MQYAETPPPEELARTVRCAWTLRGPAPDVMPAAGEPALPDGSPELILNFGAPFEFVPERGAPVQQPAAFLVGQITRPFVVRPTGRIDLLAIRFESHGASLLYRPMRELTDTWTTIDGHASPSIARLWARLRRLPREARIAHAMGAIAALQVKDGEPDQRVARAVREIRRTGGTVELDALTASLGATKRTLQRLFADQVGLSPKALAQIARFQRVFAAARDNPRALARVAVRCGYYDQAHLIRDFRRLAGDAPTRLLTSLPQFTAFFTE